MCYAYLGCYALGEAVSYFDALRWVKGTPFGSALIMVLDGLPWYAEAWAAVEVGFYVFQRLKIGYFQGLDPLTMSLNAAPMMTGEERDELFARILDSEADDPASFIRGWFFDAELNTIHRYDVLDFLCWSLFDGRNQEHLTATEAASLGSYLRRVEESISSHLENENFKFTSASPPLAANYYSNFVRQLVVGVKRQRERLFATEAREEVQKVGKIYNETYYKLVNKGGALDRNLGKVRSLAQTNFDSASESLHSLNVQFKSAKERAKARFIAYRSTALRRKLKAYQSLLDNMRKHSAAVTPDQMSHIMKEITVVHQQMLDLEARARAEYSSSLGLIAEYIKGSSPEPLRYAKYSGDPLFDVCTYPLFFHLAMLSATEGALRLLMTRRGFERRKVGGVSYYVKIGLGAIAEEPDPGDEDDITGRCSSFSNEATPMVFVHGIGIGLIAYLGLIDKLASTNRTVFLPEVSCVNGFRAWMGPSSVKSPAMVASTLGAMLGSHGYTKAAFVGHSYGTSWLSFMAKWAPETVESLVFLDPICFGLHTSHLTRKFVYQRADPGNVAYLIRTDLMVHFTLQRAFPWSRVALFTEELPCPTAVFLSEKDCLVPSDVRCSESSSDELRRRACNETTSNASTSPFLIP